MEKTFEELMHNKFDALEEYGGFKLSTKQQNAILELLNQVRESTIVECRDIALQDDIIIVGDITTRIESLPTDRIKTEK